MTIHAERGFSSRSVIFCREKIFAVDGTVFGGNRAQDFPRRIAGSRFAPAKARPARNTDAFRQLLRELKLTD